jgi:hypothetical protein
VALLFFLALIMIPERDDILPAGRAPRSIRKFLLKVGGANPYGEAKYRICKADSIMVYVGGVWTDWPEGTDIKDRDGLQFTEQRITIPHRLPGGKVVYMNQPVRMEKTKVQPLRRIAEYRWIRKYPNCDGWLFQRWYPRSMYWAKAKWESTFVTEKNENGLDVEVSPKLLALGPYPERGCYETFVEWIDEQGEINRVGYSEIPSVSKLELAIAKTEHDKVRYQDIAHSPEQRMSIREYEMTQAREAYEQKLEAERRAEIQDAVKTVFSGSLGMGAFRTKMAEKARISGHVGN